jgi:hypothetical protein
MDFDEFVNEEIDSLAQKLMSTRDLDWFEVEELLEKFKFMVSSHESLLFKFLKEVRVILFANTICPDSEYFEGIEKWFKEKKYRDKAEDELFYCVYQYGNMWECLKGAKRAKERNKDHICLMFLNFVSEKLFEWSKEKEFDANLLNATKELLQLTDQFEFQDKVEHYSELKGILNKVEESGVRSLSQLPPPEAVAWVAPWTVRCLGFHGLHSIYSAGVFPSSSLSFFSCHLTYFLIFSSSSPIVLRESTSQGGSLYQKLLSWSNRSNLLTVPLPEVVASIFSEKSGAEGAGEAE